MPMEYHAVSSKDLTRSTSTTTNSNCPSRTTQSECASRRLCSNILMMPLKAPIPVRPIAPRLIERIERTVPMILNYVDHPTQRSTSSSESAKILAMGSLPSTFKTRRHSEDNKMNKTGYRASQRGKKMTDNVLQTHNAEHAAIYSKFASMSLEDDQKKRTNGFAATPGHTPVADKLAAIHEINESLREDVLLGVPVDQVQRIQSPPCSPIPPNWMEEMVEEGPEVRNPFPFAHTNNENGLPESSIVTDEDGRHVRIIEYYTKTKEAPDIMVDDYGIMNDEPDNDFIIHRPQSH